MVFFHFVCTNKLEVELLEECGVRNVLISYAFKDRFGNTFDWIRDKFDKIFLDSGAFTAWKKGKPVDMEEYCDFILKEKGNYDVVAQLDEIGNMQKTIQNYDHMVSKGIDWQLAILQGNWESALAQFEPHLVNDYLGIGSDTYYKKSYRDQYDVVRGLSKKYKFHGFAKGKFEAFKNNWFHSIDSSTWSFGARGRESNCRVKGQNMFAQFGNKGRSDIATLNYIYEWLNEDCDKCQVNYNALVSGDYRTLLKIGVVLYYRPLFRELGKEQFNKNFYW